MLGTITEPIPIKYSKSWHSYSDPNSQIQKFLFELIIVLKSDEKKIFRNLENNKHSNLIFLKDKINFSNIKEFSLCVSKVPYVDINTYEMDGNLNHDNTSYIQKDDNLFIEFSQNSLGFAVCNCSFIGMDYNKICVSPPN
jgi:hypothetical protein